MTLDFLRFSHSGHGDKSLFHTKIMGLPFGRLIYFMYLCALYKTV